MREANEIYHYDLHTGNSNANLYKLLIIYHIHVHVSSYHRHLVLSKLKPRLQFTISEANRLYHGA